MFLYILSIVVINKREKKSKKNAIKPIEEGYSYSYISKKLNVPNGTLSYWLSPVLCTPNKETKKRIKKPPYNLLGLYIGEGTKSHSMTRIINSNPKVIKLALRWLEEVCGLNKSNFQ